MRVKLDENLPLQLKRLFTDAGHDADTALEEGLGGATDAEIAARCLAEERVLVTQDKDFVDITAYPPAEHHGIIVFRLTTHARNALLEVGASVIGALHRASPKGQLWIVEPSRVRIRE